MGKQLVVFLSRYISVHLNKHMCKDMLHLHMQPLRTFWWQKLAQNFVCIHIGTHFYRHKKRPTEHGVIFFDNKPS